MSTLGYAIVFMICSPPASSCETVAIRASRFLDLAQCQRTVPHALDFVRRQPGARDGLTAACRDLDDLCAPTPARATGPRWPAQSLLLHSIGAAQHISPAQIEAPLALLCRKPAPADCGA